MASTFSVVTRTAVSAPALFDASLSVDSHIDSLAHSGEQAIAGVTSGTLALGDSVTWRARHFGVWFTMAVAITEFERPLRFVDEQQRGPFRSFRHEHRFETAADATVMTDIITVESPVFGRLAERLVLVPYLRRLIRTRNAHLVRVLSGITD